MNSRAPIFFVLPALLLAGGCLLRILEAPIAAPAGRSEQWRVLSGRGVVTAMVGGLRPVIAGGFWLRAHIAWEAREVDATVAFIELTVAADKRPAYFWLNGARILAYDVPAWLPPQAPEVIRERAREHWAQQALRLLEKGQRWRGPSADLLIEMANIHLRCRGDLESAARYYRLAAEQPGAPYFAARIHGELLRQLGRHAEARAWLRQVLLTLPEDDPAARRAVVAARLEALELELAGR